MGYTQIPVAKYGPSQGFVLRIVLHGTVSPTVRGGAQAVARYFRDSGVEASAHYIVDPGEIVQCVPEGQQAWHDGYNENEIGIELCDPQSGPGTRWQDAEHQAMLRLAAQLVREVAARWQFARPLRRGVAPLDLSAECVTGHVDIARTTRTTDHTDPGPDFPWAQFLEMCNGSSAPQHAAPPAVGGKVSAVAACSWAPGRVDWVGRAADGSLWHTFAANGRPAGAWESLGGSTPDAPAVASRGPGQLDVIVRGEPGRLRQSSALWHRAFYGGRWHGWESLGGELTGAPAATVDGPGRLWVSAPGLDGAVWSRRWDGARWQAWTPAG